MLDDFALDLAEEIKDGVVDWAEHNEDSNEFGPICGDELDSGDQNDEVFIDAEYAVAGNEDLFVILDKARFTWLYLSASSTLYWFENQYSFLLVN